MLNQNAKNSLLQDTNAFQDPFSVTDEAISWFIKVENGTLSVKLYTSSLPRASNKLDANKSLQCRNDVKRIEKSRFNNFLRLLCIKLS